MLRKGSGMPVMGMRLTTTAMLMKAWKVSQAVMPSAISPPKVSGAFMATRIPRQARMRKSAMTSRPPR